MGRILRFSYTKLFLFLSMYFYSFFAQVVVEGMAGTVVTNLELRVGLLQLVAITQTETERREREQPPQRVRTFRIAIFRVNLSILSTCLVNPDSVCGDSLYRSFLFFSFLSTIS